MERAWPALVAIAAVLAGCSDPAKQAEAQYDMVQAGGTLDEACAAATKARDAYLAQGDSQDYQRWGIIARSDCYLASNGQGFMPADEKARAKVEAQVTNVELNASAGATAVTESNDVGE